jgi:L-asparaginase/Glu-tRNA(Gln) amidotransferase subunit D
VRNRNVFFAALLAWAAAGCAPPATLAQSPATKPRVHVIATGGTISNMGNDPRRTGAELVAGIPGLTDIADVTTEQFAKLVRDDYDKYARLVKELNIKGN